jgi:hypothetical protein
MGWPSSGYRKTGKYSESPPPHKGSSCPFDEGEEGKNTSRVAPRPFRGPRAPTTVPFGGCKRQTPAFTPIAALATHRFIDFRRPPTGNLGIQARDPGRSPLSDLRGRG